MKYFVLLASEATDIAWDDLTPEQQEAEMGKHMAFGEACGARDGVEILGGEALGDGSMATTVRVVDGNRTITDGPFAEAAEQVGGYYLVESPDLDTLIELLAILPAYDLDIRPVLDVG